MIDERGAAQGILQRGQRKGVQGYRIVFTPGPKAEIALVRHIFRAFANEGSGCSQIAHELNARGFVTAGGGRWTNHAVKKIITDEAYGGNLVYGRTSTWLGGRACKTEPSTWVRIEGAHPAIVPKKTYRKAEKRVSAGQYKRTDEYFLKPLRELLESEGFLSAALINEKIGTPNSTAYQWRFKGLINAYRKIGYQSPVAHLLDDTRSRCIEPDREALLADLRSLLEREGYLTVALINQDPATQSSRVYQWAFGRLAHAYRLIGYKPIDRIGQRKVPRAQMKPIPALP